MAISPKTPRGAITRRAQTQARAQRELERLLREAQARIRAKLLAQPSDYNRWQLPQLDREISAQLDQLRRAGAEAARAAAREGWDGGATMVEDAISKRAAGATVNATLPALDTAQVSAIQQFLTSRIQDIAATVVAKINTELGLVVLGAQSPGEAIDKLARIFDGQRERAITIVRTEVGRAFAIAAQQRMAQAATSLPGLQKQWRRSGKLHSRPGHDAIDGQIRDVDQPFELITPHGEVVQLMHPRDPKAPVGETINCGCESIPYMASWEVSTPGAKPFTDAELTPKELARNPVKKAYVAKRRTRAK